MDLTDQSCEKVGYVRCQFCNTILGVGIPRNILMLETAVTVQCGSCNHLTNAKPHEIIVHQEQPYSAHYRPYPHVQAFWNEFNKRQNPNLLPSPSSSSTSNKPSSLKAPLAVNKSPKKKRKLPSVFNIFMREEMERIKAANPGIPQQEAFAAASKNWGGRIRSTPQGSGSSGNNNV